MTSEITWLKKREICLGERFGRDKAIVVISVYAVTPQILLWEKGNTCGTKNLWLVTVLTV